MWNTDGRARSSRSACPASGSRHLRFRAARISVTIPTRNSPQSITSPRAGGSGHVNRANHIDYRQTCSIGNGLHVEDAQHARVGSASYHEAHGGQSRLAYALSRCDWGGHSRVCPGGEHHAAPRRMESRRLSRLRRTLFGNDPQQRKVNAGHQCPDPLHAEHVGRIPLAVRPLTSERRLIAPHSRTLSAARRIAKKFPPGRCPCTGQSCPWCS
jgi:hypothetical protein